MSAILNLVLVCGAVLAASIFILGFNVSRLRGVTARVGGDQMPTDPSSPLLIAMRAHGNAAEYVPTLLALFAIAAWVDGTAWTMVFVLGGTISRLAHGYGMLTAQSLADESRIRFAGAMGTYLFGFALALTIGVAAVVNA